MCEHFGLMWA